MHDALTAWATSIIIPAAVYVAARLLARAGAEKSDMPNDRGQTGRPTGHTGQATGQMGAPRRARPQNRRTPELVVRGLEALGEAFVHDPALPVLGEDPFIPNQDFVVAPRNRFMTAEMPAGRENNVLPVNQLHKRTPIPYDEAVVNSIVSAVAPLYVVNTTRDLGREETLDETMKAQTDLITAMTARMKETRDNAGYMRLRTEILAATQTLRALIAQTEAYLNPLTTGELVRKRVDHNYIKREIKCLWDKFGRVDHDVANKIISVYTDDCHLTHEGNKWHIIVGPFEMRLNYGIIKNVTRNNEYQMITVKTLMPERNSKFSGYLHPHVQPEGLVCLGNVSAGLPRACKEGRLFTAFDLMDRLLHGYNHEGHHHVGSIMQWGDRVCPICDEPTAAANTRTCHVCTAAFCKECTVSCPDCNRYFCKECGTLDLNNRTLYHCPCARTRVRCTCCQKPQDTTNPNQRIHAETGLCPLCLAIWVKMPRNQRRIPTMEEYEAHVAALEARGGARINVNAPARTALPATPAATARPNVFPPPTAAQRRALEAQGTVTGRMTTTTPNIREVVNAARNTPRTERTAATPFTGTLRELADMRNEIIGAANDIIQDAGEALIPLPTTEPATLGDGFEEFFDPDGILQDAEIETAAPATTLTRTPVPTVLPDDDIDFGDAIAEEMALLPDDRTDTDVMIPEANPPRPIEFFPNERIPLPARDPRLPDDVPAGTDVDGIRATHYRRNGEWHRRATTR